MVGLSLPCGRYSRGKFHKTVAAAPHLPLLLVANVPVFVPVPVPVAVAGAVVVVVLDVDALVVVVVVVVVVGVVVRSAAALVDAAVAVAADCGSQAGVCVATAVAQCWAARPGEVPSRRWL